MLGFHPWSIFNEHGWSVFSKRQQTRAPTVGEAIQAMVTNRWDRFEPKAALSEGLDTGGGYFLVPELSSQIIDLARAKSIVFKAGAMTVPMNTAELDIVRVTADPTMSWTGENATINTSQPTFGRLRFVAKKLACIVPLSRELMEDAPNAATEVQNLLGIALGYELDRVCLLGDATGGEPVGLFSAPGVQSISASGSPPALLFNYDTLLDALKLVESKNGYANAMAMSPTNKNRLAKLKDLQDRYLEPPADLAEITRFATSKLPDTVAALGDFRQIMVGVRVSAQIQVSQEAGTAFQADQVWIRARLRCDVQFAHPEQLVALNGITS